MSPRTAEIIAVDEVGTVEFRFDLTPAEEVPPPVGAEGASGQATVTLDTQNGTVSVVGTYENMSSNVVAAHIHCGEFGVAGPIGVTLFQTVNPFDAAITLNGTIAHGPIMAPDPGNSCGWVELEDVVDALRSGDTYVNIHTLQSPPGEIRGQIQ